MKKFRDASDRLNFSIEVEAAKYARLVRLATKQFGLVPSGDRVTGLDEAFQDFSRGDLLVGLEWDNWNCFTVVAKSPESESLAQKIAEYLASRSR